MLETFANRKLVNDQIAEELGMDTRAIPNLLRKLRSKRMVGKLVEKRKYIMSTRRRDKNGIVVKKVRDKWEARIKELGFRSLKDALGRLKRRGYTFVEIAEMFGVSVRLLRWRRKRARLKMTWNG
jgi:transcription initiation factor IIE alpha subunit